MERMESTPLKLGGGVKGVKLKSLLVILIIILIVIPLAIINLVVYQEAKQGLENLLKEDLLDSVKQTGHVIDRFIFGRFTYLLAATQIDALEGDDVGSMADALIEFDDIDPYLDEFIYLGLDGNVKASSSGIKELVLDEEEKKLFLEAASASQGDIFIRDAHLDGNATRISILSPITDNTNEKVIGILFVHMGFEEISNIMEALHKKTLSDEPPSIINKDGSDIAIATSADGNFVEYSEADTNHFKQLMAGEEGTDIFYDDGEGRKEIAAFAQMNGFRDYKGLGWKIAVSEDLEKRFAPVNDLRNYILLISSIMLILAAAAIFYLIRFISKPLSELTIAVDEVSKGSLGVQVDTSSKIKEIRVLSEALERVLTTMKRTIKRVRSSEQEDDESGQEEGKLDGSRKESSKADMERPENGK